VVVSSAGDNDPIGDGHSGTVQPGNADHAAGYHAAVRIRGCSRTVPGSGPATVASGTHRLTGTARWPHGGPALLVGVLTGRVLGVQVLPCDQQPACPVACPIGQHRRRPAG